MHRLSKLNLFAVTFVAGLSMAGCSQQSNTPNTSGGAANAPANAPAPAAATGPVLALCPKALNNPYFNLVREGANAAAKELNLPEPMWVGSTDADAAKQVARINDLITGGAQGIAISPNAPDAVNAVITRAMDKKIPVITFDADAPKSKRIAYVGTDNFAAGKRAGQEMARVLGGQGDVLVVTGGLGAFNLNERIRGFREGIEGSGVKVASLQACDDDQAKAHRIIQDYLLAHPQTAGIFAVGLWAVLPAGQIIRNKNLVGTVKVVGFDTLPEELKLVKEGTVEVLVGQRPYEMGRRSVQLLNDLVAGKKPSETVIDTGTDVVTKANVDQFLKPDAP